MFLLCLAPTPMGTAAAYVGGLMRFGFSRYLVASFAAKYLLAGIIVVLALIFSEAARAVQIPEIELPSSTSPVRRRPAGAVTGAVGLRRPSLPPTRTRRARSFGHGDRLARLVVRVVHLQRLAGLGRAADVEHLDEDREAHRDVDVALVDVRRRSRRPPA